MTVSDAEQRSRTERAEKVQTASRGHPIVSFAANTLIVRDDAFVARDGAAASITDRLTKLGPTDDLIAAVLGLTDLAYLLRKDGADGAAELILSAIAGAAPLVDDALSTWPPEEAALAGLRASRFAAFVGDEVKTPITPRPPGAGEVAGGPLARMAAMNLTKKKKDAP